MNSGVKPLKRENKMNSPKKRKMALHRLKNDSKLD